MSLQDTFFGQKKGVAQLIHTLFGSSGSEVAVVLERELGEQIRYDHREVASTELDAIWSRIPSIKSLLDQGNSNDIEALKASSYAFRMMALAQCHVRMPESLRTTFLAILDQFGLGMKEVEVYADDFTR